MSALAQILLAQGYAITGSDLKMSKITKRLRNQGAKVYLNHTQEHVTDVDIVVYSSCIGTDNPEIISAQKKKIKLLPRALLLAKLMSGKSGIAIAGAHGKTTTTALIAYLLNESRLNPTFAIGGDVQALGGNAGYGQGRYFVAEADESDGSFLFLRPQYTVITNIDKEHLDYYKNLKQIIETYIKFVAKLSRKSVLFCYGQDKSIPQILKRYKGKVLSYGLRKNCDIYARDVCAQRSGSEFGCVYKGNFIGTFRLKIPGVHNVLNSLAAIALALELKVNKAVIKKALAKFSGVERRFQIKNSGNGILIVDDYAHHPTEIKAALQAARTCQPRRVVGIFQPHRYSRTKLLKKEFGKCFAYADHLVITDIYPAFESPIKGVAAKIIYDQVKKNGHPDVHLLPRKEVKKHIMQIIKEGDLLMTLGAGDINKLSDELIKELSARQICRSK